MSVRHWLAALGRRTWAAALLNYEPAVAAARLRLGGKAFEATWAEGRAMTLERVLDAPGRAAASPVVSVEDTSP